jgi:hypothetical protein
MLLGEARAEFIWVVPAAVALHLNWYGMVTER